MPQKIGLMQLSNLLLNFMTKSFLFPEIDSERAVPAPNENGLRRPALRRGFGKASVFLPAGRPPGSFAVFERCGLAACFFCGGRGLVRAVRIELTTQHWKCRILPLNY